MSTVKLTTAYGDYTVSDNGITASAGASTEALAMLNGIVYSNAYHVSYSPTVAGAIAAKLRAAGIECSVDADDSDPGDDDAIY